MLLLGNSFVLTNDLDLVVDGVFLEAGAPFADSVRLAEPGLKFTDHVERIQTEGTPWADAFATAHTWTVLQEQSQIPGFPEDNADRMASGEAALALDAYAAQNGAQTLFLMTWGRLDGDDLNPELFPDYPTMQDLLVDGYLDFAEAASADGTPAWIAPAGLAWRKVYEEVLAAGEDPLATDSRFAALYSDDGNHPSPHGTWLAACTIYSAITGESAEGFLAPEAVTDADDLARVAYDVVHEDHGILYPWTNDDPGDTGDTGNTGAGDTAALDSGDAADDATPEKAEGCGCAAGGQAAGWVGLLGLTLATRRRRS